LYTPKKNSRSNVKEVYTLFVGTTEATNEDCGFDGESSCKMSGWKSKVTDAGLTSDNTEVGAEYGKLMELDQDHVQ
jgi:hypothetical protein